LYKTIFAALAWVKGWSHVRCQSHVNIKGQTNMMTHPKFFPGKNTASISASIQKQISKSYFWKLYMFSALCACTMRKADPHFGANPKLELQGRWCGRELGNRANHVQYAMGCQTEFRQLFTSRDSRGSLIN